jgi:hypothetical protein
MNTLTINNVVLNDKTQATSVLVNASNLLSNMEANRITWEQGAYRTSNQALYAVLAECLAFCGELSIAEAKQRSAALEAFFKERNYQYKKDSPLVTRVIKAVFGGIDRRRISTYSLVLRQAQKERLTAESLAGWIERNDGIQEIRLSHSKSYVSPKTKAESAKQIVEDRNFFLGFAKSELLAMEADADFMGDTCVLLAEQQADGSFGIRSVLRSKGLINAAYVALYAKQNEVTKKVEAEIKAANDADGAVTTAKAA